MRKLTKKKYILASNGDCDLKNENKVARDAFFLDFYFSIGGSVHAQKKEWLKKKEAQKPTMTAVFHEESALQQTPNVAVSDTTSTAA